ncbi:MAG: alpha/beta fold hydrolase [Snowella sp.]|nr:alpha/beta fold hydrolase [Snowella sp.]
MQATSPYQSSTVTGTHWQWQGHNIYYVKAGDRREDRPPLLLVHGFGASTDHWRKNIAELQQDFEVWAIDLLGFGRSAKPALAYGGELWRNQLQTFICEVIQQPTVLAGNSLGGYCSLSVASYHPDLVKGVVLLNSAGPFSDTVASNKTNPVQIFLRNLLLQPWASYLLFQYVRNRKNIRKTLEKVYLDKSAITDQLVEEIYRPSCDAGAPQVFASVFKTPQGDTVDSLLASMQCPLLMLWGEGDPWMKARDRGAKFKQYYQNITEYYLNAGHCPHDEIPEQINQLIRGWMLTTVETQSDSSKAIA